MLELLIAALLYLSATPGSDVPIQYLDSITWKGERVGGQAWCFEGGVSYITISRDYSANTQRDSLEHEVLHAVACRHAWLTRQAQDMSGAGLDPTNCTSGYTYGDCGHSWVHWAQTNRKDATKLILSLLP